MMSRNESLAVVREDAAALGRQRLQPRFRGDTCWKFQWHLRHAEYYGNRATVLDKIRAAWHVYWWRVLSIRLGFSIGLHTFGPGLQIMHRGTIVVNRKTRVGKNCRIHVCVNIGEGPDGKAPVLGDNVYIGPGVKMFGGITIADNISIGANAVVNKSFLTPGVTIAGVPARVIKTSDGQKAATAGSARPNGRNDNATLEERISKLESMVAEIAAHFERRP